MIFSQHKDFNIEFGIHYVVTKGSKDGLIKIGQPLLVRYICDKNKNIHYDMFGIIRSHEGDANDYRHFGNKEDICKALEGVELELDKRYARELVDKKERQIKNIIKTYKLEE